ncbi:hypothetical protein QE152_g33108 [Popillia japonica]|uniref:Uncharacterized protein n=1 Tax=Popillia japonica TaxID=7064 RepID=A0AAW1IY86_POPJA
MKKKCIHWRTPQDILANDDGNQNKSRDTYLALNKFYFRDCIPLKIINFNGDARRSSKRGFLVYTHAYRNINSAE